MRHARPWFWKERDAWYIWHRGKKHRLAKGKKSRKAAVDAAHALLSNGSPTIPKCVRIKHIIDAWLQHAERLASHQWYADMLSPFKERYGEARVMHLRRKDVRAWLAKRTRWSDTTKNKFIGCLQTALNHAVDEEVIPVNPIAGMKKPRCNRRERIPTPKEWKTIIGAARGSFKMYVYALSATGARPGEVAKITASDFSPAHSCWVLPAKKHKTGEKTGNPRVIYLTPAMVRLCLRLAAKYPTGPLFRGRRGQWTTNAVRIRFRVLREDHPELQGIVAYCLRHAFVTEALERGISDATVAELAGHTDTSTIHRFYSHLTQKGDHLRSAIIKAREIQPRLPAGIPQ
jgi:integrase/recombinase XerC